MSKKYLVIDGNSLGHFANNGGRLMIGDQPVHAIYNFLRTLRQKISIHGQYTPLVLWDGMSWRNQVFSDYKAIRDKADTPNERKLLAKKEEYKKQSPYIKKALRFLGIAQVSAINMEADDLAAIISDRYVAQGHQVALLTGDKDWIQLVGPNVVWRDFINDRVVTKTSFEEFTGVKTPKQFVEVKALCGDAGDSIPGVGRVGEKGAIDFINTYGSFSEFLNLTSLHMPAAEFKKLPKKYRDLVVDESKAIIFERNIGLVDLRTTERPDPINFKIDQGDPSMDKFEQFCEILLFKSITQELSDWMRVFPAFHYLNEEIPA